MKPQNFMADSMTKHSIKDSILVDVSLMGIIFIW